MWLLGWGFLEACQRMGRPESVWEAKDVLALIQTGQRDLVETRDELSELGTMVSTVQGTIEAMTMETYILQGVASDDRAEVEYRFLEKHRLHIPGCINGRALDRILRGAFWLLRGAITLGGQGVSAVKGSHRGY